MTTSNRALKGQAYRSSVPAVSGSWQLNEQITDDWGWRQIADLDNLGSDITFIAVSDQGAIGLEHMIPCTPFRVWNEIEEYFEGISSDDGLKFIVQGDEAFVDFGRFGDETSYNPLQIKNLWQDFISPIDQKIKACKLYFRYGFLLENREEVRNVAMKIDRTTNDFFDTSEEGFPSSFLYSYAEPLDRWYAEFNRLALAKDIWSVLINEEYDELKKTILLRRRVKLFFATCRNSFFMELKDYLYTIEYERNEDIDLGGILDNATVESQSILLSVLISHGVGEVTTDLSIDANLEIIQHLVPKNLCGAVWLQFTEYMSEGGKILNCLHCQQPFIRLRGQHRDRVYCTNACKQKAWRSSPEQRAKRQKRDQP